MGTQEMALALTSLLPVSWMISVFGVTYDMDNISAHIPLTRRFRGPLKCWENSANSLEQGKRPLLKDHRL